MLNSCLYNIIYIYIDNLFIMNILFGLYLLVLIHFFTCRVFSGCPGMCKFHEIPGCLKDVFDILILVAKNPSRDKRTSTSRNLTELGAKPVRADGNEVKSFSEETSWTPNMFVCEAKISPLWCSIKATFLRHFPRKSSRIFLAFQWSNNRKPRVPELGLFGRVFGDVFCFFLRWSISEHRCTGGNPRREFEKISAFRCSASREDQRLGKRMTAKMLDLSLFLPFVWFFRFSFGGFMFFKFAGLMFFSLPASFLWKDVFLELPWIFLFVNSLQMDRPGPSQALQRKGSKTVSATCRDRSLESREAVAGYGWKWLKHQKWLQVLYIDSNTQYLRILDRSYLIPLPFAELYYIVVLLG